MCEIILHACGAETETNCDEWHRLNDAWEDAYLRRQFSDARRIDNELQAHMEDATHEAEDCCYV